MARDEMLTPQYAAASPTESPDVAGEAKEKVQAQAGQVASEMSGRLRAQIDTHSDRLADQVAPFAEALHSAGTRLEGEGSDAAGRAAHRLAGQVGRLGNYLRESGSDRFLDDLEEFARQRPWLAGALGTAAGFMAARFLKASSERRHTAGAGASGTPMPPDEETPLTREGDETWPTRLTGYPTNVPGGR